MFFLIHSYGRCRYQENDLAYPDLIADIALLVTKGLLTQSVPTKFWAWRSEPPQPLIRWRWYPLLDLGHGSSRHQNTGRSTSGRAI